MNVKYHSALITVKDIALSRAFYEKILNQKVEFDFGENISFHGGFAIHDIKHFSSLLFQKPPKKGAIKTDQTDFELYFETDELDELLARVLQSGAELVHPLIEQPWGQRAFRFYDPDRHIIEIGEPMSSVVNRLAATGMPEEKIAQKTGMPLVEVQRLKNG
jgi:catechol 2,3-dioxygenase-like lactoylglutathione lyase family enzyme